ncbi:hypothetical protein LCGC14_2238230 [marine sediment metagenome]|uniref:Uncharacterized protein n=1 Tax=marine sediment metagenome TaxID=412755 RepID=A0A0F9FIQ4_9ZZZZ
MRRIILLTFLALLMAFPAFGIDKNVAGQKVAVYAFNTATGVAQTADATSITAQISKDGGASAQTNDVTPIELDATNHPGVYIFDLTQSETNADLLIITAVSSTTSVLIEPVFEDTDVFITVDSSGVIQSNVVEWLSSAALAVNVSGVPLVDVRYISGDAQSGTDLKDFVDAGYDPGTNKVQGVVLTDTTTAVTELTPATIWESTTRTLTSASGPSASEIVTAIFAETLTALGVATVQDMALAVYAMARGKFTVTGNSFTYFDDDDTTDVTSHTIATGGRTPN